MSYFIVNMLFNVPVEKDIKSFYKGVKNPPAWRCVDSLQQCLLRVCSLIMEFFDTLPLYVMPLCTSHHALALCQCPLYLIVLRNLLMTPCYAHQTYANRLLYSRLILFTVNRKIF